MSYNQMDMDTPSLIVHDQRDSNAIPSLNTVLDRDYDTDPCIRAEPIPPKSCCSRVLLVGYLVTLAAALIFLIMCCATLRGIHQRSVVAPFLTLLQVNDIYEIYPVGGLGGFSRLAGLKKSLHGDHVLCVFAGDLISPSPLSIIPVGGEKLLGKHMIALANDVFDVATLGNHEFDYDVATLRQRLLESHFPWLRTNVRLQGVLQDLDATGVTKAYDVRHFAIASGKPVREVRIAFLGIVPVYSVLAGAEVQSISETIRMLPEILRDLRKKHAPHIVIAITHLNLEDDIQLVSADLGIDLIFGGHEHDNIVTFRSPHAVPITKADSDARSAYIHTMHVFDPSVSDTTLRADFTYPTTILRRTDVTIVVERDLKLLDDSVTQDSVMSSKVDAWWVPVKDAYRIAGYDLESAVMTLRTAWDLRRSVLSSFVGTLEGRMFVESVQLCGTKYLGPVDPSFTLFSSGVIRLDGILAPGHITVYDIFRISPFITQIWHMRIRGNLILHAIQISLHTNVGTGGFLLWSSSLVCAHEPLSCTFNGVELRGGAMYDVYMNDYVALGKERNLQFLKEDGEHVVCVGKTLSAGRIVNIQDCFIEYFSTLDNQ